MAEFFLSTLAGFLGVFQKFRAKISLAILVKSDFTRDALPTISEIREKLTGNIDGGVNF